MPPLVLIDENAHEELSERFEPMGADEPHKVIRTDSGVDFVNPSVVEVQDAAIGRPALYEPIYGQVEQIVQPIIQWAIGQRTILAAALVGSWARGTAHNESDIDLMFLAEEPLLFRTSSDWLSAISWGDRRIKSWEDKDYGAVWSRHVCLNSDDVGCAKVEFSFGRLVWASIAPLDPGTRQVMSDGYRILYDPEGILAQLVRFVSEQSR